MTVYEKNALFLLKSTNDFIFHFKRKWNINTEKRLDLINFLSKTHVKLKHENSSLYGMDYFILTENNHQLSIIMYNVQHDHLTPENNWSLGMITSQLLLNEMKHSYHKEYAINHSNQITDDMIQKMLNYFLLLPPLLFKTIFLSNSTFDDQHKITVDFNKISEYFNVPLTNVIEYAKILNLIN